MKERPIIFTGESVKAILAGEKTQTRRVVKEQPGAEVLSYRYEPDNVIGLPWRGVLADGATSYGRRCPHGQPGDRLWVREAWAPVEGLRVGGTELAWYRADGAVLRFGESWRSPIHMPRWASRLTLTVTGVRVERLQEIDEADAIAEGVDEYDGLLDTADLCVRAKEIGGCPEDDRVWFSVLWDRINGKRAPWSANPWVWVLTFEVVK